MTRKILLDENGKLRLFRDGNSRLARLLHDDGGLLFTLELWPGWRCSEPLSAVKSLMESMRPMPPRVIRDRSKNILGGFYVAAKDVIALCGGMSRDETAGVILHELGHSSGHSSRLGRKNIVRCESFEPSRDFSHRPEDTADYHEELVAGLSGALVAVRVGIDPTGAGMIAVSRSSWFKQASRLPLDTLMCGIADARGAAGFILNDV